MRLNDVFKSGEFWTSLEKNINQIKESISSNSKKIKKLHENDKVIVNKLKEQVKNNEYLFSKVDELIEENKELRKDIKILENKLWIMNQKSIGIPDKTFSQNDSP